MAVLFTVLIPPLMLGVVLALGRYEELLLPAAEPAPEGPGAAPAVPDARKQPGPRASGPGEELSSAA
ncbi:hypothetical protein J7I94_29445 [Streptomyces sp. ISL-12]|uniref:hypothetical protein n=1 Tax=Streptomyces sp. ISL-12 TaxID=2819177 RepID=UPI001BE680D0|nr:hypothetical protein [Streptomyces sp. ISL-12]MBT2414626.1 hypothetical protein [Streptomyces sp. ISL-12]